MKRTLLALVLTSSLISAGGCVTACAPFDYEYNAYGGRYDRVDRVNGRAGSRFQPAHAVDAAQQGLGAPPTAAAESAETPETPDSSRSNGTPITSNDRYE